MEFVIVMSAVMIFFGLFAVAWGAYMGGVAVYEGLKLVADRINAACMTLVKLDEIEDLRFEQERKDRLTK